MPPQNNQCINCKFYFARNEHVGECRRYPPYISAIATNTTCPICGWQLMTNKDMPACGEFSKKTGVLLWIKKMK